MHKKRSLVCFLGAGFSYAAGVPLARDLFESPYVLALSDQRERRFRQVIDAYQARKHQSPMLHAEEFLGEIYERHLRQKTPMWSWAVEYICAVIASAGTPPPSMNRNPRYSNRINRPSIRPAHQAFWQTILDRFDSVAVVTTNYDILIEQGLRHRPMKRPPSPGCFYGGLPRPQLLKGAAQPFSAWSPDREIEMTGAIPVYKLHGSLSWSLSGEKITAYQDLRSAFRNRGDAAIIPPIPDKEIPVWLRPIWEGAHTALSESDVWVICGYSVPAYDVSVRNLLEDSSATGARRIIVLSPEADQICGRLADVTSNAEFFPLPGLPCRPDQFGAVLDAPS